MNTPIVKKNRFSLLWLFPLFALAVGLYLAYDRLSDIGPVIRLKRTSAEGLIENKTKIRYKYLDIGTITEISLSADRQHVIATAQMTANAAELLNEDSQFWLVEPQVSAAGITGLNTLVSGSYIEINPGISDEKSRFFEMLPAPPLLNTDESGLRITLSAESSKGLNIGSPLYYRGVKIGQIEQIHFGDQFSRIYITAFVRTPYDALIHNDTKFWNASGFELSFTAAGAQFSMYSMETLALGGIVLSTPDATLQNHQSFDKNKVFNLYPSEKASLESDHFARTYFVLYFEDSVHGLLPHAPVEFNGMTIGEVSEIRLLYDQERKKIVTPVVIALEWSRIDRAAADQEMIKTLVAQGLRASLKTGNFLTGKKMIHLALYPDNIGELTPDRYSRHLTLPVHNGGIHKIPEQISDIVAAVNHIPFTAIGAKTESLLTHVDHAAESAAGMLAHKEMQKLGKTLQTTLQSVTATSKQAQNSMVNLNEQMRNLSQQLEATLYGLSPESSLYYSTQQTVQQMQILMRTIDGVMQKIKEKPNALLMGE